MDNQHLTDEIIYISGFLAKHLHLEKSIELAIIVQRNKIEYERNEIFKKAFAVHPNAPSALEAIAMQLGYKNDVSASSITDAIFSLRGDE